MKKKVLLTVLSAIFVVAGCLGLSSCKKDLQALDTPSNIKMENREFIKEKVKIIEQKINLRCIYCIRARRPATINQ